MSQTNDLVINGSVVLSQFNYCDTQCDTQCDTKLTLKLRCTGNHTLFIRGGGDKVTYFDFFIVSKAQILILGIRKGHINSL